MPGIEPSADAEAPYHCQPPVPQGWPLHEIDIGILRIRWQHFPSSAGHIPLTNINRDAS